MFTGLIETTGTVLSLEPKPGGATRITVAAPELAGRWKPGDSIAVNGTCLTALPVLTAQSERDFAADLAEETLRRTTLSRLQPGSLVNLELPTPAGSPLGGHVVQGHVDGTGRVISLKPISDDLETTDWRLTVQAPKELAPAIISQGSVTVDGISLTVAKLDPPAADGSVQFEIAVIPHTYNSTHLHSLVTGDEVNLETDVLARYAAQRAAFSTSESPAPALTIEYLISNGY